MAKEKLITSRGRLMGYFKNKTGAKNFAKEFCTKQGYKYLITSSTKSDRKRNPGYKYKVYSKGKLKTRK